jgi:hypothetical protein
MLRMRLRHGQRLQRHSKPVSQVQRSLAAAYLAAVGSSNFESAISESDDLAVKADWK